ncbi:2-dehydropantoate 2-reductase PanG [Francisella philomiragia]|uniref:2-dehydropantoate 2-reductase PanG n=1 Tax=Francisella philomiragia TaxID=28110 RepID=A0ABS1G946_9GAMM|nr:2-dehydropantoate 2-reductase PanG [Francisella philomiragia]MBK2257646.1 2-dehydropantoate 2-reductase PanG [Francisella philomiragia]MBK2301334.1 2-dehydropantoate 2-reductase PanG [Francisella philomiragia]
MQQVPRYVIVGNGNVAAHMCYYFECLKLDFRQWSRNESLDQLDKLLDNGTHVLVLIKDSEIQNFVDKYLTNKSKRLIVIHFSGLLDIENAYSAHPLQSFPDKNLYSLDEYKSIAFVTCDRSIAFSELLPKLPNANFCIDKSQKAYYHAMCVLANNVSTLIWQKFYTEMQNRFGINQEYLTPFLETTFKNIKHNHHALSGPIARGDSLTLQKDLNALIDDDFYDVFRAIVNQFSNKEKR